MEESNNLFALNLLLKGYKLAEGKKNEELVLELALLYQTLGQNQKAKQKFVELIKINGTNPAGYYGLAIIFDEQKKL